MISETIVGGVIASLGALVGVIAGVLGERCARRIGGVHSAVSEWKLERGGDGKATYAFSIKVFNEMTSILGLETSRSCSSAVTETRSQTPPKTTRTGAAPTR